MGLDRSISVSINAVFDRPDEARFTHLSKKLER